MLHEPQRRHHSFAQDSGHVDAVVNIRSGDIINSNKIVVQIII